MMIKCLLVLLALVIFIMLEITTLFVVSKNLSPLGGEYDYRTFYNDCDKFLIHLFNYIESCPNYLVDLVNYINKVGLSDFVWEPKIILGMFFNLLFTYFFCKNFLEKHLFSKNKIRNFNFDFFKILLFLILILTLPRVIARNCIIVTVFGEVTYISIVLSTLWMLPFMSYIANIFGKYLTMQTIKKEDLHFFNENVINSINIYSICFILVFLYINIHYTGEIFGIILYRIFQTFSYSPIHCYADTLPANLVHVFSTEKGELNTSSVKFNGEDKEVHTLSFLKGAVNEKLLDYTNWKTYLTDWGTKPLDIQGKCLPLRQFEKTNLVNTPTIQSFTLNYSRGFFTSASLLDHSIPNKTGVIINIGYEPTISNYGKFWLTVRLEGKGSVLKGIKIMEGVFGNRIFPSMDKNKVEYLEVNYPPQNESRLRFGNNSGYRLSNFDVYLGKLSGSLKLPVNMGQVVAESPKPGVRNNLVNKWNSSLPADINENTYLRYFHDRRGEMGQLYAKEGRGYLSMSSRKLSLSLDSVKCSINPVNLSTAIEYLNKWIPVPALDHLTIDTQVKRISRNGAGVQVYSTPGIVKYSNIINPTYASDVDMVKFQDEVKPVSVTSPRVFLFSNVNDVLKRFISCFANSSPDIVPNTNLFFYDREIGSIGRLDILKIIKKDLFECFLDYPKSFVDSKEILSSIKYPQGSYTVFEHGEKNGLVILATSNRDLMESVPHSNCIDRFHLLSNVDLRFKDEIWEFLENPAFKTRGVDGLRYKEAIVVWLDNFSIQMATFDNIHDGELSYDSQRWYHIMAQDSQKAYKNTFNLWDINDQKEALTCLSLIRGKSTTS
jgi:hypothetical protein